MATIVSIPPYKLGLFTLLNDKWPSIQNFIVSIPPYKLGLFTLSFAIDRKEPQSFVSIPPYKLGLFTHFMLSSVVMLLRSLNPSIQTRSIYTSYISTLLYLNQFKSLNPSIQTRSIYTRSFEQCTSNP